MKYFAFDLIRQNLRGCSPSHLDNMLQCTCNNNNNNNDNNNNNNNVILIIIPNNNNSHFQHALHVKLECSLVLTHIELIYTLK